MQGEGWFIVMSSCVALGCPANICWATGPLTASRNLLIHIRKHQPYHMYMYISHDPVYLISFQSCQETVDILGLQVQLIILNTPISIEVKMSLLIHQEMELNPKIRCGWTYQLCWTETLKDSKLAITSAFKKGGGITKKEDVIDSFSLFLTLSFPLESLRLFLHFSTAAAPPF